MNRKTLVWKYQFTLKSGHDAYFNLKTNEWAIKVGSTQLAAPNIKETTEILGHIVEISMNTLGEGLKDMGRKK